MRFMGFSLRLAFQAGLLACAACGSDPEDSVGTAASALVVHPGPFPTVCGVEGDAACTSGPACTLPNLVDVGGTCVSCSAIHYSAVAQPRVPGGIDVSFGISKALPVYVIATNENAPYDQHVAVVQPGPTNMGDAILTNVIGSQTYKVTVVPGASTCTPWSGEVVAPVERIVLSSGNLSTSGVGGWAEIGIQSDGRYSFRGHVGQEFGNVASQDYTFGFRFNWVDALSTASASMGHQGNVHFPDHESEDWQTDGYDPSITSHWATLRDGNARTGDFKLAVGFDLVDLLKTLAGLFPVTGGAILLLDGAEAVAGSVHCAWNNGFSCH